MSVAKKLTEYRRKRDFEKTKEPAGGRAAKGSRRGHLAFVIQKHAASHLHFDLRLEMGGVMKSWAVPKGPSMDPAVKRLAMEVEDHPIEYNTFEGTIPQGEYGGGTVMLWDSGTYYVDDVGDDVDQDRAAQQEYRAGKMSITFEGERMKGSFALIRTSRGERKPQWLLIKHRDEYAQRGSDITAEYDTSVTTGRTMEEIAQGIGKRRVWSSNRPARRRTTPHAGMDSPRQRTHSLKRGEAERATPEPIQPMQPRAARKLPDGDGWIFEPAYGGKRAFATITPDDVHIILPNGRDVSTQYPEITRDLAKLRGRAKPRTLIIDAELLAPRGNRARLIATDLLLEDGKPLVDASWAERRTRLEKLFGRKKLSNVRLSEISEDGEKLLAKAAKQDWDGVVAKQIDSTYQPGEKSPDWKKVRVTQSKNIHR